MDAFIGPFSNAAALMVQPSIWVVIIAGTIFGIVSGALPGIGTTLAYGLVLPFTFSMDVMHAVTILLAVSVGVSYGNSIPAILLGVPGTPSAVLTVIDGHTLHKRGESGLALALAFLGAVFGQIVSVLFFIAAIVPLAAVAFLFLAPEMFSLFLFGMIAIISLTGKNVVKGFIAAVVGLLIGMIGLDPVDFTPRFDFGFFQLRNGVNVAAVIIGILAVSELLRQSRQAYLWSTDEDVGAVRFPPLSALKPTLYPMLSGTVIGTIVGAVPGAGSTPAAILAYQNAQLASKHPEQFGKGSPEGIAANEAAQNAANSGELIPTLGLGIPGSGSMVILMAAVSMHGFIVGPSLVREAPQLLGAAVAGLVGGTIFVIITGWPIAKIMLRLMSINRAVVIVLALMTVMLGVFSINYRVFDVLVCFLCGALGYFMMRYGYSTAAAALAVVLSAGFESSLRRGLTMFDTPATFLGRPITGGMLILAAAFLFVGVRRARKFNTEPDVGVQAEEPDAGENAPQDDEPALKN